MSIRERLEKATPGPWEAVANNWEITTIYTKVEDDSVPVAQCDFTGDEDDEESSNHDNDAEFIAAARTDIPALLEAGDALRKAAKKVTDEFYIENDENHETNPINDHQLKAAKKLFEAMTTWEKVSK
jgi:hypothetical protein